MNLFSIISTIKGIQELISLGREVGTALSDKGKKMTYEEFLEITFSDADYAQAFKKLMELEGDYVSDPDDPGGETKYGISKRSYPNLDIKHLTLQQAADIYYRDFWKKFDNEAIPCWMTEKLFFTAVNVGIKQAVIFLQRALQAHHFDVEDDGILGPVTLTSLNKMYGTTSSLLCCYRCESAGYYRLLAAVDPRKRKFLNGWLKRAYS
jgi:hypothetical protein